VKRAELEGFKAFEPSEEDRLRDVLEDETQLLMQKINALLDPEYTWGENLDGDGLQGVARFFD